MIGLVAKALAALLGGISAWGITAAPDGIDTAETFGLLGVVATVLAVFAVPNRPAEGDEGAGEVKLILCVVAGCLLAYFLVAVL